VLVIYAACRKIDYNPPKKDNKAGNDFFLAYPANDKSVLAVQGYMRREDEKYNFIDKMVERIGFPWWNKATVLLDDIRQNNSRSGTGDSLTIVYLPFVREGENFVNAIMQFSMTQLDTNWRGLCD